MTRHIVTYTTAGPATYYNVRRDPSGEPLMYLDDDEVRTLRLDLTGYLDDGETVSSISLDPTDVTATSSVSSPYIDLTLSEAGDTGKIIAVITLSSGAKLRHVIHARRRKLYAEQISRDYA